MLKQAMILCSFLVLGKFSSAQNLHWDSLGAGFEYELKMMYYDSVFNKLYVSMYSAYALDGLPVYGIASWDGTKWDTLGLGFKQTPFSGSQSQCAYTAARYDNKIFFGGNFQWADGKPIKKLATWDGTNWDSLPQQPNQNIQDLIVYHGKLYACGIFSAIGGNSSFYKIARWDGSVWETVGNIGQIIQFPSFLLGHFCIYNDELYLSGQMDDTTGNPINVIRWNDTTWNYVGNGIQEGGVSGVGDMAVYNNELWIGGWFSAAATGTSNFLTRWDGTQFKSVGGTGPNMVVYSLFKYKNKLYAGGGFTAINGLPCTSLAMFDGTKWCTTGSNLSQFFPTHMASYNDSLIVGGQYGIIDGDTIPAITMWTGGDYVDSCLDANIGFEETQVKEENKISVYPNPIHTSFTISSVNYEHYTFEIYNSEGKVVLANSFDQSTVVNSEDWQNGLYFIRIMDGKNVWNHKVIKQ